jgi:hypothetical protein
MEEDLSLLDEINAKIPASDFEAEYYPGGVVRASLCPSPPRWRARPRAGRGTGLAQSWNLLQDYQASAMSQDA